eukprot:366304-Chlamydomonas_euryale.AAC.4
MGCAEGRETAAGTPCEPASGSCADAPAAAHSPRADGGDSGAEPMTAKVPLRLTTAAEAPLPLWRPLSVKGCRCGLWSPAFPLECSPAVNAGPPNSSRAAVASEDSDDVPPRAYSLRGTLVRGLSAWQRSTTATVRASGVIPDAHTCVRHRPRCASTSKCARSATPPPPVRLA